MEKGIEHSDTSLSSKVFGMPLDGLEAANSQVSDQALKLAREIIRQTGGTFTNPDLFWSPLYGLSPQDTESEKMRSKVEDVEFGFWGDAALIKSPSENGNRFHIGKLGSFDEDKFEPKRFRLEEDTHTYAYNNRIRAVINGYFEVALNELLTFGPSDHRGFSKEIQPITVASLRAIYADRGVFQDDERIGKVFSGKERIIEVSGKRSSFLVKVYFRAIAKEAK